MITTEELPRFLDTFNGDDAHLVQCIEALLSLDAKNALVPHGIGGHARGLLSAAMHRLAIQPRAAGVQGVDDIERIAAECDAVIGYTGPGGPLAEAAFSRNGLHEFARRLAALQPPTRQTCAYCAVAIDGEPPKTIRVDVEQIGSCELDVRDGVAYMPAVMVQDIVNKSCLKAQPPKDAGANPIIPDDQTRASIWPAAAQFRAFEWLRVFATADGAPEEAGVALDTWHSAAMELRAMNAGQVPEPVARAAFNDLDKDGFRAFVNDCEKSGLKVNFPIYDAKPKDAGAVPLPEFRKVMIKVPAQTATSEPATVWLDGMLAQDVTRYGDAREAAVRADAVPEHIRRLIGRIDMYRLRMSYNDSYFGEPAGLLKGVFADLAHATNPIYPSGKTAMADPLAGVTVYTATVEYSAPFETSPQHPPAEPAARAEVGALGFARPAELDDVRRNKDSHAAIAIFLQPEKSDAHSVPVYAHPSPAHAGAGDADTKRLDALLSNSWDLRCFNIPTPGGDDADIGWRVIERHLGEPRVRVVGEIYKDDPRAAIDAAIRLAGGDHANS